MPFVDVPDVIEVVLHMGQSGGSEGQASIVLHFHATSAYDFAKANALAAAVVVAWNADLAPVISNEVVLNRVSVRDLSDESGVVGEAASGDSGDVVSPALPPNVAWSLKKVTGLAGRANRGRVYHYGLAENQVTGETVLATPADDIANAWNAFWQSVAVGANDLDQFVLVSYNYAVNPDPPPAKLYTERTSVRAILNIITLEPADTRVDTQRRRLT